MIRFFSECSRGGRMPTIGWHVYLEWRVERTIYVEIGLFFGF